MAGRVSRLEKTRSNCLGLRGNQHFGDRDLQSSRIDDPSGGWKGRALYSNCGGTSSGIWGPILAEVLQGFDSEREFRRVRDMLDSFPLIELGRRHIAIQAAKNFRAVRRLGVIVSKTIDTIIATRCIQDGLELLHNDRDFDPFAEHLGLRVVACR